LDPNNAPNIPPPFDFYGGAANFYCFSGGYMADPPPKPPPIIPNRELP